MNPFVDFLKELGFNDPRQTSRKDVIELVVHDALKAARKKFRARKKQFLPFASETTRNSTVQEYYAVQDKQTVGRVRLESFATHSVIQLINLGE
jgi:hypothetical protein